MSVEHFACHTGKRSNLRTHLFEQMLQERKRVFVDMMGWELPFHNEMEMDHFDDENTDYIVITECNVHATSLRIHKRSLNKSLMSVISNNHTDSESEIWEISRFLSSSYSLGVNEYILIYFAFKRFIELDVREAHATLNVATARLFRLLGIEITQFSSFDCKVEGCQNYTISTNCAAFERFYRRMPARAASVLRTIGEQQEGTVFNPLISSLPARRIQRT